tara:strand:+ start:248 stop:655 length:408 start_codon:yes stop_codon:yes gene_type:complete
MILFNLFKKYNELYKKQILDPIEKVFDSQWYVLGKEVENFYDYFKFIKFLNLNHEIIRKLKNSLNFGVKSTPTKVTSNCNDSNHHKTLLNFIAKNKNVVVVLKNNIEFFKSILGEKEYIKIIHDSKPFSFGYDMH